LNCGAYKQLPPPLGTSPTPSEQTQKSFQKQPTISLGFKKLAGIKKTQGAALRFTRSVGLGFKTPVEAIKVRVSLTPPPAPLPLYVTPLARLTPPYPPTPLLFYPSGHLHRQEVPVHRQR